MPTVTRLSFGRPTIANIAAETYDPRYQGRWRSFSVRYRKRNPFCALCMEKGSPTFCDVVDHKYPVSDGGPLLPGEKGVWSLCHSHHSGWKARLEAYARSTGQMDRIVQWCDDPASRPRFPGGDL